MSSLSRLAAIDGRINFKLSPSRRFSEYLQTYLYTATVRFVIFLAKYYHDYQLQSL